MACFHSCAARASGVRSRMVVLPLPIFSSIA
jgi:hypothetical protein